MSMRFSISNLSFNATRSIDAGTASRPRSRRFQRLTVRRVVGALFLSCALYGNLLSAAQLTYGKYFGSIQMDGSDQQIAVSLDAFITQKDDPTQFPQLNIILRSNLGGYQSSEYVAFHYYDPPFNFEQSILQLDAPDNDLTATLQLTTTDTEAILEGPVVYRPSQKRGKIRVVMAVDNVHGRRKTLSVDTAFPFLSKLSGEYFGTCGKYKADLQIETGRGVAHDSSGFSALSDYAITGRLGYEDETMCPSTSVGLPSPLYCLMHPYSSGIYYLFDNKLTLLGAHSSIDCDREGDRLTCVHQSLAGTENCTLTKKMESVSPPVQYPRQFYLPLTSEQKKPLPDPFPPANTDILRALGGSFYGFLHHENRDQYQLIQMNVLATTSTENPHVQNAPMITATVSALFGSTWDASPLFTTAFSGRIFYLNTGFMLENPDQDTFLVVDDWRQGYLRGEWYSRAFGRVGTFEFQKDIEAPVPSKLKMVPRFDGQYVGPVDSDPTLNYAWRLQLTVPSQVAPKHENSMHFLSKFQMKGGITVAEFAESAAFDMYTGSISSLFSDHDGLRLIGGDVISDSKLRLVWTSAPIPGALMWQYDPQTYQKVPTHQWGIPLWTME